MAEDKGGNSLLEALANPTVFNPLAAYQGAAQTANAIWQTRDWQAKQAAGEAQQGAIDPATGEYSPNRMRQGLAAAGPTAALAAQSGLAANQALSSDQLNQARDKLGWVAKASGAALTAGDFSDAAMMRVLMQGSADKMLTMPEIMHEMQSMPSDPAGRKAWLEQHQAQSMSAAQQLELRYGAPITVDDGQVIRGGTRSMQTGAITVPPGQGVQRQTGPETNAGMVEVSDDKGNKYMVPRSSLPGASGVAGGVGTGRPPPALRNPNAPPPAPAAAPPPAPDAATPPAPGAVPAGATLTEIAPDRRAALTASGAQASEAFKAYAVEGDKAVQQQSVLSSMLADTKGFTTGPGAATMANFQRRLQRIGTVLGTSFGVDPNRVAANESFNKLASQLADAQGAGSDARLSVNKAANPHEDMSPAGVDLVIRQLQGNADYKQAKSKLAAAFPDKEHNLVFEDKVRANLDPRAFQFARMMPGQRKTYYSGLSEQDQKAVRSSYNWAATNGLIDAGNAGQ